jgi:4-hydroxy-3-polyprenylbenzoate decarboxylase
MPWNLIHARNVVAVMEAGATVIPASPAFYGGASTLEALADTVVDRILDQLELPSPNAFRWKESAE